MRANTRPVEALLFELARALLPAGMTPKHFNELARQAFVRAAADSAKLRNGRTNYSRISAQTGLTRASVKHLLRDLSREEGGKNAAPIDRVVSGWRADKKFLGMSGRPLRLRVVGANPSFSRLAKKYAGDIPHRALLDEMRERGSIVESNGYVELAVHRVARDYSFLSHVLPGVKECLQFASRQRIAGRRSLLGRKQLSARSSFR